MAALESSGGLLSRPAGDLTKAGLLEAHQDYLKKIETKIVAWQRKELEAAAGDPELERLVHTFTFQGRTAHQHVDHFVKRHRDGIQELAAERGIDLAYGEGRDDAGSVLQEASLLQSVSLQQSTFEKSTAV